MRSIVLLAIAVLAGGPLFAQAAAATTEIIQQRTSDGRVLLTDRPSAGAKTERSWRLSAEDPAAARRRALDVQVEAQIVSERVERRIAMQQRVLDEDMQRRSVAFEREMQRAAPAYDDYRYGESLVVYAPGGVRGGYRHHGSHFDSRPGRDGWHGRDGGSGRDGDGHGRSARHPSRFTGPGAPGSR